MKTTKPTSEFIIETVSPIFNKQGYVGTSLSQLTDATGLTKGAIYCNFANKEDLAVKAFERNVKLALTPLFKLIEQEENSIEKLYAITNYHKTYYDLVNGIGGCPMLRVGMDTKYNNPLLFERARSLFQKFLTGLKEIIDEGIARREIRDNVDSTQKAQLILSLIEGNALLAFTHNDNSFLVNGMNYIQEEIITRMKI